MSCGHHLWLPAAFPIDVACRKTAEKVANGEHVTTGCCYAKCHSFSPVVSLNSHWHVVVKQRPPGTESCQRITLSYSLEGYGNSAQLLSAFVNINRTNSEQSNTYWKNKFPLQVESKGFGAHGESISLATCTKEPDSLWSLLGVFLMEFKPLTIWCKAWKLFPPFTRFIFWTHVFHYGFFGS